MPTLSRWHPRPTTGTTSSAAPCVTDTGEELGTVADIFRVGEGEVYVVRGPRGEILVPAVAAVVKELSPADKRMVVDADALGLTNPAENEIKP